MSQLHACPNCMHSKSFPNASSKWRCMMVLHHQHHRFYVWCEFCHRYTHVLQSHQSSSVRWSIKSVAGQQPCFRKWTLSYLVFLFLLRKLNKIKWRIRCCSYGTKNMLCVYSVYRYKKYYYHKSNKNSVVARRWCDRISRDFKTVYSNKRSHNTYAITLILFIEWW